MALDIAYLKELGSFFVRGVLHPVILVGSPAVVLALTGYLVVRAFRSGISNGFRSVAGVLLPMILVTFVFLFDRGLFSNADALPAPVGFVAALAVGVATLGVVRFLAGFSAIPVAEMLLSASFSILVFGYVSFRESRILVYCYGIFAGFLLYVILLGLPGAKGVQEDEVEEL